MKLVLFGATGHTGTFVLDEALTAGHQVTVLVRHPHKLKRDAENLRVVQGDGLKQEDVVQVIKGQDAVISTISEGPEIKYKTQSTAVKNMIAAMEQFGVQRIVCMGALGILQHNEEEIIRDRPGYPALYYPLSLEHSAVLRSLKQSGLKWTQVCPPTISAEPANGRFLVRADYLPSDHPFASAGNIGRFIMQELVENKFIGKRVGITDQNER